MNNPNVCENCLPIKNYFLADTGTCGLCGKKGECFDAELIAFYRSSGIDDEEFIWLKLPRLRGFSSRIHSSSGQDTILSWAEIEKIISQAEN
ncbi:hypothetical protein [Shewanella baltica]|uniref:hypothetical protein n=1 Tax=Shewanella baltica TaxID=62322 RepID=UPI0002EF06BA|nr:hypothetical protein [Shewanella baltica]